MRIGLNSRGALWFVALISAFAILFETAHAQENLKDKGTRTEYQLVNSFYGIFFQITFLRNGDRLMIVDPSVPQSDVEWFTEISPNRYEVKFRQSYLRDQFVVNKMIRVHLDTVKQKFWIFDLDAWHGPWDVGVSVLEPNVKASRIGYSPPYLKNAVKAPEARKFLHLEIANPFFVVIIDVTDPLKARIIDSSSPRRSFLNVSVRDNYIKFILDPRLSLYTSYILTTSSNYEVSGDRSLFGTSSTGISKTFIRSYQESTGSREFEESPLPISPDSSWLSWFAKMTESISLKSPELPSKSSSQASSQSTPPAARTGPEVWQWQAQINRGNFSPILIVATVFDAEKDPVLIDFAMKQSVSRSGVGEERFHISSERVDHFAVVDEPFDELSPAEKTLSVHFKKTNVRLTANLIPRPYAPPDIVYLFLDGRVKVVGKNYVVRLPTSEYLPSYSRIQKTDSTRFRFSNLIPSRPMVFEPNTIEPVPLIEYFKPKGNNLRPLEQQVDYWYAWDLGHLESKESKRVRAPHVSQILSAEDLDLRGGLAAKRQVVWTMLAQEQRPTVAQMLELTGPLEVQTENPFARYSRQRSIDNSIVDAIPALLTRFEYYFSGATWYGLGRDIYLLSDTLDAFYTFLGQPERVKRLHASASSFDSEKIEIVVQFLKDNGFNFEAIHADSTPQIMFDVTSFQRADTARFSQSAQLMRAAYQEWARLGRDPKDLAPKVNFISTGKGSNNTVDILYDRPPNNYFSALKFDRDGPLTIPFAPNSKTLQYTATWHAPYGPFESDSHGQTHGPPGAPADIEDRLNVLWEIWEAMHTVMSEKFLERVNWRAREYQMSFKRTTPCAKALE